MTSTEPVKLGFLGIQGRVGQAILQELHAFPSCALVKGLVRADQGDRGALPLSLDQITTDLSKVFEQADVVIDFTNAASTSNHLKEAVHHKKPFFLGTTGLEAPHFQQVKDAARHIPLLQTANTSMGMAILEKVVAQVARILGPEYDIEIAETHHRHKKDAPSGTSLSLGKIAAKARGLSQTSLITSGERSGSRASGTIGFSVIRGGESAGEHDVYFMGPGETLRFSHRAMGRHLFARGALKGALWLVKQKAGLYKMADILEFGSMEPGSSMQIENDSFT